MYIMRRIHLYAFVMFIIRTNGNDDTDRYITNELGENLWDFDDVVEWPDFHLEQDETLGPKVALSGTLETTIAPGTTDITEAHAEPFEAMVLNSHKSPEIHNVGNNSIDQMGYEFDVDFSDIGWNVDGVTHFLKNQDFPVSDDINSAFADDHYDNAISHIGTFQEMLLNPLTPLENDNVLNDSSFYWNNLMGHEFQMHFSDMVWDVDEVPNFHINPEFPVSDNNKSGFAGNTYSSVADDPPGENPVTSREVTESAENLHAIYRDENERNNEDRIVEKGETSKRHENVSSTIPSYDTNEISKKMNGVDPGANYEEGENNDEDDEREKGEAIVNNETKNPDDSEEVDVTTENAVANRCTKCNVTFRYTTHFENHCREEHGMFLPFQCRHCKNKFCDKRNMIGHMKAMHKNAVTSDDLTLRAKNELVGCDVCGIIFQGYLELERHALTEHEGIRTMACQYCPKKYFKRKLLLEHTRLKHSQITLKCNHCNIIFDRTDTLNEHVEYCEQRQKYLMKDTKIEWEPFKAQSINCRECEAQFDTFKALQIHFKSEHPTSKFHPCGYCEKSFANKNTLMTHLNIRHPDKLNDLKYKINNRPYVCQYCKKEFDGVEKYEMHGKLEHRGQPMFHCKECGKEYTLRRSLTLHDREHHKNSKTSCVYCSRCYHSLYYLKQHEEICRKRCKKEGKKREEGVPGYYCDVCDKTFYVKEVSFVRHVLRHTEYDRCRVCGEGFHRIKQPNGLNNHMALRHPSPDHNEVLLHTAAKEMSIFGNNNVESNVDRAINSTAINDDKKEICDK